MFLVFSLISQNTGVAPSYNMQLEDTIKEKGVVITSSPFPISRARTMRWRAAVPEFTTTACFLPACSAKRFSNSRCFLPKLNCEVSRTFATALRSFSVMEGLARGIFISFVIQQKPAHCLGAVNRKERGFCFCFARGLLPGAHNGRIGLRIMNNFPLKSRSGGVCERGLKTKEGILDAPHASAKIQETESPRLTPKRGLQKGKIVLIEKVSLLGDPPFHGILIKPNKILQALQILVKENGYPGSLCGLEIALYLWGKLLFQRLFWLV